MADGDDDGAAAGDADFVAGVVAEDAVVPADGFVEAVAADVAVD